MKKLLLTIGFGLFLLGGCREVGVSPENRTFTETKLLMGTTVEITIRGENKDLAGKAAEQAFREIEAVDSLMSTFKKDSEISRINREGARQPIKVSRDTFRVVRESIRLSELSGGAFDITVAPLVNLWRSARKNKRLPGQQNLKKALALVGYQNILLDEKNGTVGFRKKGMEIDLGGIAKGYAVDKAVEKLRQEGVKRAIINAGGDLYLLGRPPDKNFWKIGLRNPYKKDEILGTIKARDEAIATSGNYENYFTLGGKRYGHLLDPRTGKPTERVLSVTVLAKDALSADGLATAIFVLGVKKGLGLANRLEDVETIIVSEDDNGKMVVSTTKGLKDRLSLNL
ncbi:MAG: FAD:protein FMN transferase [Nitrospirae bacterium]|nr:FAD:protein FMN transferase [Nitrospirota bacterium]